MTEDLLVAGREEPFHSAICEHLKGHTQALEGLAIEILARGLSVRDIEDAFKDESGRRGCMARVQGPGAGLVPRPSGAIARELAAGWWLITPKITTGRLHALCTTSKLALPTCDSR